MTQCGRILRSSTAGVLLCLKLLTIKVPLNWTQGHLSSSGYIGVEPKQLYCFLGLPNGKTVVVTCYLRKMSLILTHVELIQILQVAISLPRQGFAVILNRLLCFF